MNPRAITSAGKPRLYRDERHGVVGSFVFARKRDGHGTRDRNFKPLITIAMEYLFRPTDIGASYFVSAPVVGRKFTDISGDK